jgi:hypothetical protein
VYQRLPFPSQEEVSVSGIAVAHKTMQAGQPGLEILVQP